MNVESSNCYPRFSDFLHEVERVLRPGGVLLHADYRYAGRVPAWEEFLRATSLVVEGVEDITANVVRSLEVDNERKERLIREHAPAMTRGLFRRFAGVRGTGPFHGAFAQRRKIYKFFRLRKPGPR